MPTAQLYDNANIDALNWPQTERGQQLKAYLTPLIKNGSHYYVDNIHCQFKLLVVNNLFLPITITDTQYDNAFVCSPYSHYVTYGLLYFDKMKSRGLKRCSQFLFKGLAALMRKGKINKVIIVNNWLFTTNPHPPIDTPTMRAIVHFLTQQFPEHAIIFRSVTKETAEQCYKALEENKFKMIASRYVYLTDGNDNETFKTRLFKSDLKLLQETPYTVVEGPDICEDDIPKIHELYRALYIQKYSSLNPQFNQNFIRHALSTQMLNLKILKHNNTVNGVVGYICQNGIMISPFFGYQPDSSDNKGIYRILSTLLMLEAQKHKVLFNQSAGGSFYKKIRRAVGRMEYTAVYTRHLPWRRRLPWKVLSSLLNSFGKYTMKKY